MPVKFKDAKDYVNTFEPLLLEECRAQILRSLDSTEDSNYFKKNREEINEEILLTF